MNEHLREWLYENGLAGFEASAACVLEEHGVEDDDECCVNDLIRSLKNCLEEGAPGDQLYAC